MLMRRRGVMAGLALQPLLGLVGEAVAPGRGQAAEPAKAYPVRTLDPAWITVAGGLKLAGRLWIPEGGAGERFPVVFEYIPYRTHDSYRAIDDHWGPQLAAKGIAFARVDIRGSGNSEGVLKDEYLASEQQDGVEIIAWLAGSLGATAMSACAACPGADFPPCRSPPSPPRR